MLGACVACAQPADAAQSQMAQQLQIIPHFAKVLSPMSKNIRFLLGAVAERQLTCIIH